MKKSPRIQSSPSPRKTSRARILTVLGAIGLSGLAGLECGSGAQDDTIRDLRAKIQANEGAIAASDERSDQCRTALEAVTYRKRVLSRWLDLVNKQLAGKQLPEDPDEGALKQCIDITDSVFEKMANDLADMLGITNSGDIDKLFNAMKRGYTKVESISKDGKYITLVDPKAGPEDMDSRTWITLDEAIEEEDIPEEYLPEIRPKSEQELAMEQQIADGNAGQVVSEYPLDSLKPSGSFGEPFADGLHGHLSSLQEDFNKVDDLDLDETEAMNIKKDLFCRFYAKLGRTIKLQIEKEEKMKAGGIDPDSESTPDPSDEDMKKMQLMELYMDALMKAMGIDDPEVCMLQYDDLDPCYSLDENEED